MKTLKNVILSGAALAVFAMPVVAQTSTTTSTTTTTNPPAQATPQSAIGRTKVQQQDRIANGIASGQLTAGEAANLEKKETQINQEAGTMRKLDNGQLTAADKAALQQQQNKLSGQIYADKHNSTYVHNTDPKGVVDKQAMGQQERIANGIKDGQLTAPEASQLERKENAINKEVAKERAANGGHLTAAERNRVVRQQDRLSGQIYKDRHEPKKK